MAYSVGSTVFENWTIKRKIGEGSFGKVYEIQREDFGEVYCAALKVISVPQSDAELRSVIEEGMSEAQAKDYFYDVVKDIVREFSIMSKLKGTGNVVNYEDHVVVEHTNGIGWDILIRMELLNPLLSYAYKHPFTRRDIIKLGIDICKALELCQKYNIIHRDIKPENIFVSDNGDFKLGDFGIARTIEKTISVLSKKGTYNYMAPEVYRGAEYSFNVDTYSLGIVLYRLLNKNRAPFLPPSPEPITFAAREVALAKRMSGSTLLSPIYAQGRLSEIVLKACAYDPKDRYDSPMQMRQELEAILYDLEDAELIYPSGDEITLSENQYISKSFDSQDFDDEMFSASKTESVFSKNSVTRSTFDDSKTESVFGETAKSSIDMLNQNSLPPNRIVKNRKKIVATCALILFAVVLVISTAGMYSFNTKKSALKEAEKLERYQSVMSTAAEYCSSDPHEAMNLYLEAQEMYPDDPNAYVSYAYALYCANEYDNCIAYIEDTLALGKKYSVEVQGKLSEILGAAYFENGEYAAAASFFRLSTAGGDITVDAMRDYAVSLGRLGDIEAADEVLKRMFDSGASDDVTTYVQAEIDYALKNYLEAESGFCYVLELSDNITLKKRALRTLAEAYRECSSLARIDKSPISLPATKEVELLADGIVKYGLNYDSVLLEMLAMAYFEAYQMESQSTDNYLINSAKCFEQVIELGIEKDYLYCNLYAIYYELEDYKLAEDVLRSYEQAFPNSYVPHALRAIMLITIENQQSQSKRDYSDSYEEYLLAQKLLKSSDDTTYYQQLESMIEQLKQSGWL